MRSETLPNGLRLPKIGFGTWKIGGDTSPDPRRDERSLQALRAALEAGYTHFDTAEMYARGHAEELLARAIRETRTPRESLFLATKVTPSHLRYQEVLDACHASLRRLQTDTLDLYLIHWPSRTMRLEEAFQALNRLVAEGKVRHLGISNFDLPLLQQARALSETPLLTNQVPYSLTDRSYVHNGVLAYCQGNDLLLTAYSPVDEGRLPVSAALREAAAAHGASPFQIALAWLVQQPRVITIPMSANPAHIVENFAAAEITLTPEEMARLTP